MIPVQSQCTACTHLDREAQASHLCNAFPDGIPPEIWTNEVAHTRGYPGDHGIHLELIPLDVLGGRPAEA